MSAPRKTGSVLGWHIASTLLVSTGQFTIFIMLALIARIRFGAGDWQTLLVTMALPAMLLSSIFWNALLRRISLTRYLMLHWAAAMAPIALIAFAQNYWHLLLFHAIAAVGFAGWSPVNGVLLKRFYNDRVRGRAYGALNAAQLVSSMVTAVLVGWWQTQDADAFRWYLPAIVAVQGVGIVMLMGLSRGRAPKEPAPPRKKLKLRDVLAPVLHLHRILRGDRNFFRYEVAFMTYGVGFMICEVLLPLLVTDKFRLSYDEFAERALFVQRLGMLLFALPMGWVLDRIGAAKTSAISFGFLGLYPLFLILATGADGLTVASGTFGIGMAGVMFGWMLGPVSLAPNPESVPQYVAIHTTLVGIRGLLFQSLGMAVYVLTGSFAWPLAIAVLAFLAAALQMWFLDGSIRRSRARPVERGVSAVGESEPTAAGISSKS